VIFVVDASDSTGVSNFQLMIQFVGMVIRSLDIDSSADGPTISRVGLVTFSDSAVLQFHLNRYTTKAALLQAVNVPYLTGATNTDQAIRFSSFIILLVLPISLPHIDYTAAPSDPPAVVLFRILSI